MIVVLGFDSKKKTKEKQSNWRALKSGTLTLMALRIFEVGIWKV